MTSAQAYAGTAHRTFAQALVHLMETQYGVIGSHRVLDLMAGDIQALVEQFYPSPDRVPSGWMVFTGVKATGHKARPGQSAADHELVTLVWPVLLAEDVQALAAMPKGKAGRQARQALLRKRVARIVEHGLQHPEGPVLLTLADLGSMLGLSTVQVSQLLQEARQATGKSLLTKGYFFDQGMRPTHKDEIIALYEAGMDEADIARRTQHQPTSVGRYIRDYERVKRLLMHHTSVERIGFLTELQPNVIKAYIGMVYLYHPELEPEQVSPALT